MAELCRKNALPSVGCVIMASGLARRFGSNKLLADFGGRPLLCRALEVTATPALATRVVVTCVTHRPFPACSTAYRAGTTLSGWGWRRCWSNAPVLQAASSCPEISPCCSGRRWKR